MPGKRETVAHGWAMLARMEPIMAMEGRDMSERDKKLLVEALYGITTLDEIRDRILREAGYGLSPVQSPPIRGRARQV